MAPLALIICLVLFLAGPLELGVDCVRFQPSGDYLNLENYNNCPKQFNQYVKSALADLNIQHDNKLSPEAIMAKIIAASNGHEYTKYAHIYQNFKDLSTDDDHCDKRLTEFGKDLWARLKDKSSEFQGFKDFIEHYGKRKFRLCAKRSSQDIRDSIDPAIYTNFDEFFQTALGVNEQESDSERDFYSKLKGLNLARVTQLNTKGMATVAKRRVIPKGKSRLDKIETFLDQTCKPMLADFGNSFDVINLASAFRNDLDYESDILILNEYHRICLAMSSTQKREEILDHLRNLIVAGGNCFTNCVKHTFGL